MDAALAIANQLAIQARAVAEQAESLLIYLEKMGAEPVVPAAGPKLPTFYNPEPKDGAEPAARSSRAR